MDNQLAFETVLSRKLDELRAELMSIYTQHLTRGNQDMPTDDMAHQEQPPNLPRCRPSSLSSVEGEDTPDRRAFVRRRSLASVGSEAMCRRRSSRIQSLVHPTKTVTRVSKLRDNWLSKLEVARSITTVTLPEFAGDLSPRISRRSSLMSGESCAMHSGSASDSGSASNTALLGVYCWACLCVAMLGIEMVCVPLDVGFDLFPASNHRTFLFVGRCFWSLDLLVSLLQAKLIGTGRAKGDADTLISRCSTSWFVVNVVLLMFEWFVLLINSDEWKWWIIIARVMRFSRFLRREIGRAVLQLDDQLPAACPFSAELMLDALRIAFFGAVGVHWVTCVWFWVGRVNDAEWQLEITADNENAADAYIQSLYMALGLLHGRGQERFESTAECAFAFISGVAGLLFTCFLVAKATSSFMTIEKSAARRLRVVGDSFILARRIPPGMSVRIQQSLRQYGGVVMRRFQDEERLMQQFPESLRRELLSEVRQKVMVKMQFFADLSRFGFGIMHAVTADAMTQKLHLKGETVFSRGFHGQCMYFVDIGNLEYIYKPGAHKDDPDEPSANDTRCKLWRKDWISEPALWIDWVHRGECNVPRDSVLLELSSDRFCAVISESESLWHAVKYAKHFVSQLHQVDPEELTDMVRFSVTLLDLTNASEHRQHGDHFAFISHYKKEAGTEASMMQAELQQVMQLDVSNPANDLVCPVFLDSENLISLTMLKEHVKRSHNLILLLTPDVLMRPWCLVEIATAFEHEVPIVLVRVERPGFNFEYPTEEFYTALKNGELYSSL